MINLRIENKLLVISKNITNSSFTIRTNFYLNESNKIIEESSFHNFIKFLIKI